MDKRKLEKNIKLFTKNSLIRQKDIVSRKPQELKHYTLNSKYPHQKEFITMTIFYLITKLISSHEQILFMVK